MPLLIKGCSPWRVLLIGNHCSRQQSPCWLCLEFLWDQHGQPSILDLVHVQVCRTDLSTGLLSVMAEGSLKPFIWSAMAVFFSPLSLAVAFGAMLQWIFRWMQEEVLHKFSPRLRSMWRLGNMSRYKEACARAWILTVDLQVWNLKGKFKRHAARSLLIHRQASERMHWRCCALGDYTSDHYFCEHQSF